jgi:saccharopine dehydrogenase-like NADP-dependent oxidoreductase
VISRGYFFTFTEDSYLMKKILLFGAGKSATVLINYLLQHAMAENWSVTVVDANPALVAEKIGNALGGQAASFDIRDDHTRSNYIQQSDIVISLLPPALHFLVAKDCLSFKKHLLTASYIDEQIGLMRDQIEEAGVLFLCEMGLDPGIDHMSAMKLINSIKYRGGKITSFLSHCGGLVAPESDNNPWRYKISWNPRNVVNAGKGGALFRLNNVDAQMDYEHLFAEKRFVYRENREPLCWYPNRDSLSYIPVYDLNDCATFIRTTLRHPDFIYGWKNVIDLKLTDDSERYNTNGKTLMQFFKEHMDRHGFGKWLQQKMQEQFESSKKILEDLVNLVELQDEVSQVSHERIEQFMMVTEKGALQDIDLEDLKTNAAATVAAKMHDAKLTLNQLFFLGMDDNHTLINKGDCTTADVLQFALEKKLALLPGDKDMVVMIHEIEYELEGNRYKVQSSFSTEGENDQLTAMAKTVGLPLGIAARLILNGEITAKGLRIPVSEDIYLPVLNELERHRIAFTENEKKLN